MISNSYSCLCRYRRPSRLSHANDLAIVVEDGMRRIVELHATIYEASSGNLLNWEVSRRSRSCACSFADKTHQCIWTREAADGNRIRFEVRVSRLVLVFPTYYGTMNFSALPEKNLRSPNYTHQAILSLPGTYLIGRSSPKPLLLRRLHTALRKRDPEYSEGARPNVARPLMCFFPNIVLDRSWYAAMHSSSVMPSFPSITAIKPPVLVPATRSNISCGSTSWCGSWASLKFRRLTLIWDIKSCRIKSVERPRTPPPSANSDMLARALAESFMTTLPLTKCQNIKAPFGNTTWTLQVQVVFSVTWTLQVVGLLRRLGPSKLQGSLATSRG